MSKGLSRTYRPSQFSDVFGQKHVVQTIQNQISGENVAHAYLFAGPRGIGKTTIARLLAKTVNCEDRNGKSEACGKCKHCDAFDKNSALDIVEIDAASNTGVDNVRENIIEAIRFAPTTGSFKIFIIDEVHMLSASAFNALLKTLEEPPAYGIFVLATTELHKIPQTIISRCQRFDFHRITEDEIVERLKSLLKAEGVEADEAVLKTIAKLSEGGLRDAESLLSQIMALGEKKITEDLASIVLPRTNTQTVLNILSSCEAGSASEAVKELQDFVETGGSVKRLNDDLIEECRQKMMESLAVDAQKVGWFRLALEAFLKARTTPAPEVIPHLPLEMAIIEICGTRALPLPKGELEGVAETDEAKEPVERVEEGGSADSDSNQTESKITEKTNHAERRKEPQTEESESVDTSITQNNEVGIDQEKNSAASGAAISVEELRSKWKRCCQELGKTNIALPLALQEAQLLEINDQDLLIGFEREFHVDTINQRKNLDAISDAIKRVVQIKYNISTKFVPKEEENKELKTLASAFGGSVVE